MLKLAGMATSSVGNFEDLVSPEDWNEYTEAFAPLPAAMG